MKSLKTRPMAGVLAGLLLLGLSIWWGTGTRLTRPLETRLEADSRNARFEAELSGRSGNITFNIVSVPDTFSRADVGRTLYLAGDVAHAEAPELNGDFYLA